jgi:hypothetical protein
VVETPEALEAYLMRAHNQDDVKRRAHRCITEAQEALAMIRSKGSGLSPEASLQRP